MRLLACTAVTLLACSNSSRPYGVDGGDLQRAGAEFVSQRGCPTCHDASDGAGTLAGDYAPVKGTLAFPPNLTNDRTTGLGGWADIQIIRAFRFGTDDESAELCAAMPRFPMIGDVEAQAIVAYLRSLPPVSRQIPESRCPPIKPAPTNDMAMPPTDL
jgi:mono/diheme cytochrome c family protein